MASGRKSGWGRKGRGASAGARGEPEQAGPYPILFEEGNLKFRIVEVSHPVAYGREILVAAETHPLDELNLFVIRLNGDIEDVPLDQLIDLRDRGADRFVAFWNYRTFKFRLNGTLHHSTRPAISGASLYELAQLKKGDGIFQKLRGRGDCDVEPHDVVDLCSPVIQRFITGWKPGPAYWILVNGRTRSVVRNPVTFRDVVLHAFHDAEPDDRFSVTYRYAASDQSYGTLLPGDTVQVKSQGTTFEVVTDARLSGMR
ncbi:multiubiquitin domain-containing protein [Micromonospora sp. STR1s_5]|nr:multiubiquitin domain-containing protein [Micromonospora sp. STR1s_5]